MISINLLKPLSGRPGKTGDRHNLFFKALIVAAIGVAIIIAGVEIMHLWLAAPYRLPAITWREVETEVTGAVDTASESQPKHPRCHRGPGFGERRISHAMKRSRRNRRPVPHRPLSLRDWKRPYREPVKKRRMKSPSPTGFSPRLPGLFRMTSSSPPYRSIASHGSRWPGNRRIAKASEGFSAVYRRRIFNWIPRRAPS